MGAFFESALLFSLAVLIILIGLLIYYFKGRVNDLEQKSLKCLELVGDVYKSHLELKQHVASVASVVSAATQATQATKATIEQIGGSPRIQVHLEELSEDDESSDEDSDDEDSDEESDSVGEFPPQIKMVNVDLTETLEAEEIDIDVDIDVDIDEDTEQNNEIVEITETDPIVVNKIEDEDAEETQTSNESSTVNDRESYKKMALPALRGFIISKGYQTDSAKLQKMKKNELIDLIMESQK
jgi:hypothetical protein